MYVLDTSFFTDAGRFHLPLDKYPDFWSWLVNLAEVKTISIPEMVYTELIEGNDNLSDWIKKNKNVFVDQNSTFDQISTVMSEGYGDIDVVTLEGLKADPWVIAQAMALGGTVVTSKKFGNQTAPYNKKIPSVCAILLSCCTITSFLWQMRASMPR